MENAMSDDFEPPLVVRPENEPPMVRQAEPAPPLRPRPGFWEACLFTLGFWVVLAGAMMAILLPAIAAVAFGGNEASKNLLDDPSVRTAFAWAMPGSYLAAFIYCLVVVRVVIGRTWPHDLGLTRLPPYHLILALLALPGFMVLSEAGRALETARSGRLRLCRRRRRRHELTSDADAPGLPGVVSRPGDRHWRRDRGRILVSRLSRPRPDRP